MMDAALFTDEPAPASDLFTDEPAPTKTAIGMAKNLGSDIMGLGKSLAHVASSVVDPLGIGESLIKGSPQPMMQKPMQNLNMLKSIPGSLVEEGKRIGVGKLATGHPIDAANKFGNALYEKPLTTALDVMPVVAPAARMLGIGGKAAAGAGLAEEGAGLTDDLARNAPGAPPAIDLGGEAAGILKAPPEPPPVPGAEAGPAAEGSVPTGSTFQETVANLKKQIPSAVQKPLDQVGDFLNQKYGKMAEKPGFGDLAGDAMIRRAQGMRFRELGGTPGQARALVKNIGEEGLRELTDVAKEKGITKSPLGFQRRAATKTLNESSGRAIGGIRELAAKRGAIHNPTEIVKAIRAELDPEYLGKGTSSSQKGAYLKALEDIKAHASTPDVLAKKITKMNQYATKNKMTQATGALTDVANTASKINNQLIKSKLSPQEIDFYDKSLRDFGASKIFEKLQSYEVGREMGGRAGVGGLWRNIKQGAMDMGGSKVMENFYDKFGPRLKSGGAATKNLANLSEGAIEDLLSSLDDAIDEIGGSGK